MPLINSFLKQRLLIFKIMSREYKFHNKKAYKAGALEYSSAADYDGGKGLVEVSLLY